MFILICARRVWYEVDAQRSSIGKWPLLLNCGHAFCDGCVNKRAKQEVTAICCPTCKASTPLADGPASVAYLPIDIYLLGLLTLQRSHHAVTQVGLEFLRTNTELTKKEATSTVKKELCGECSIREATCKCTKCECNMCTFCFDTVHKSSKILRKHQAVPLYEDESLAPIPAVCKLHDNRPIEYFCEDDSSAICSHCVIVGEHQSHSITAMEIKNKEAIEDIEKAVQASSIVLRTLHKSDRILATVVPDTRQSMRTIREELQQRFRTLHGQLQSKEWQLLEELGRIFKKEIEPLDEMKCSLRDQIRKVDSTLKDTEKAMGNQQHLVVNAQQVLARLQSIQNTPCYAQIVRCESPPISFEINQDITKSIDKVFDIETKPFLKLEMLALNDMPEHALDDDQDSISTTSTRTSVSRSTSWAEQMSLTDSEDMNSVLATIKDDLDSLRIKTQNRKKRYRKIHLEKNQQTTVIITHVKNPNSFMVQRYENIREWNKLSDRIQKHCNKAETAQQLPADISEDSPVLAQYSADHNWYRAIVRSVVVEDTDPNIAKVMVSYVDFGNSEVVYVSKLRKITPSFMKLPTLAIHTSLIDIVSSDQSGQWVQAAVASFVSMTDEKPMLMHVVEETETGLVLIDLCKPVGDDGADDRPVSVRDALVFLEHAIFVASPKCAGLPPRPQRRYISQAPLCRDEHFTCIVTDTDSPDNFYIQKVGDDAQFLCHLMENIQKVYATDDKNLWSVFYPQLDLVCIAQYEVDQQWYRAQVVGVPGRCNVDVQYVDFGNMARVSHVKLRCIQQSFLVLPKQAIHCSLADVEPVSNMGWTTEAVARFTILTYAGVTAVVKEVEDRHAKLLLFSPYGVCINTQLVNEGLAISTGPGSTQPTLVLADGLSREGPSTKTEQPRKILARDTQPVTKAPQQKAAPQEEVSDDSNKAVITHIVDPGHLYLQLATAPRDGLLDLMTALEDTYADSPVTEKVWQTGDQCALRRKEDGKWYRGLLQEKASAPDTFKVFFIDFGYRVETPVSELRPLVVLDQPAYALRCHLVGIQPAGDPNQWSRTATEYLTEITKETAVFIIPKGEADANSMPVDLLVERRIDGDALNPELTEYPSLTDILMERGVALPNRRLTRMRSGPKITVAPKPVDNRTLDNGIDGNTTQTPMETSATDPAVASVPPTKAAITNTDRPAFTEKSAVQQGLTPGTQEDGEVDSILAAVSDGSQTDSTVVREHHDRPLADVDPGGGGDTEICKSKVVNGEQEGEADDFPPPVLPTQDQLVVVPTFLDWDMIVYVQQVKEDEDMEGRYGFFLKEHTLETIIQDKYLRQRYLHRARIPRDGNCLFRSFAQAIFSDQGYQGQLRQAVVSHLEANWDTLGESLGIADKEMYLNKMRQDGQYAGEPEIQAVCQEYKVSVELYMGGLNHPVQVRTYNDESSSNTAVVRLVYVSDGNIDSGHYDLAVVSADEVAPIEDIYQFCRGKKIEQMKHWLMYRDNTIYDDSLLNQLTEHLNTHYTASVPDPTASWKVGQAVVGQFTADDTFYRARITSIDDKGIQIQYIDFGNSEYISTDRLRDVIILTEIPQQCFRCVLHGVNRNKEGRWSKAVLDFAHKLMVNQQCDLEIVERPTSGEPLSVRIRLPNGRDLATVLLDAQLVTGETAVTAVTPDRDTARDPSPFTFSLSGDPTDESAEESDQESVTGELDECDGLINFPDREVPTPFLQPTRFQVGEVFIVSITQVNRPDEVYLGHVHQEVPPTEQMQVIQSEKEQFYCLDDKLNADGPSYPPLSCVKPGVACCGQYSEDQRWYRGEVLSVERSNNETIAGILFVDYGTFEPISSDRLRTLPEDMLSVPPQSFPCHIRGLVPADKAKGWSQEAMQLAKNFYTDKVLIAIIQSDDPRVEVRMHSFYDYEEKKELCCHLSQTLVAAGLAQWEGNISEDGTIVESMEEEDLDDAQHLQEQLLAKSFTEVD